MTVIDTDHLTLRPFAPDDVAAYAAIRAKPEVVRYLPGGPESAATARTDAERLVPMFIAAWREPGYGPWAVIERASERLIGHAGLRHLPELGGETEILYMLDSARWGRGYATEAARAARDYGFGVLGLDRLIAMALPGNTGSIRVMQKLGMAADGPFEAFGITGVRYILCRDTWRPRA